MHIFWALEGAKNIQSKTPQQSYCTIPIFIFFETQNPNPYLDLTHHQPNLAPPQPQP